MLALISENWIWFLLAFIFGLVTAWWVWGTLPRPAGAAPAVKEEWIAPAAASPVMADASPVEAATIPAPTIAAPVVEAPAEEAPPAPVAPIAAMTPAAAPVTPVGGPDDLTLLKGVGAQLNRLLNSLGVTRFDQIAAWTQADIDRVDAHLGAFKGRIMRDNWVEQAGYLAKGDLDAFRARFGEPG